ncbi:hypothetical protein [Amycolatopsis saalfeldensis]|uniref:hypothetical protein n=1 Tax=Amycolatopsis saalfeldensis TaxID=394193 RepID=UPI001C430E22|nr:hypothetical protein [Amycolatopsis saalfeldensis]
MARPGSGLPPAVVRGGLRYLEQRAAEAGGEFLVERREPDGIRLLWTVPVL